MPSAVIGALRVNLGLNSAGFTSGMAKSKMTVKDFGRQATAAFLGVAAVAAGAFAKVMGAAQKADEMFKSSQSLGVPIEDLGRLAHGAEMSGSSFEGLSKGVRKASQTIQQAIDGATNEGAAALANLGIELQDTQGKTRGVSDVILDMADKFKNMPDGVNKTAIAMAVFGRSGTELIPFLNQGSEAIKEMGDEAERLGLVFSEKTGRAAEIFNDNISRLTKSFGGLWNRVLANVIPAMAQFTTKVVTATTEGGKFDGIVNLISKALLLMVNGLSLAFDHLQDLYDLFKIWIALKTISYIAAVSGAFITMAKTMRTAGITMALVSKIARGKITVILLLAAAVAKLTGTYDDLVGFISDLGEKIMASLPDSVRQGIDDISDSIFGMGDAIAETDRQAAESLETFLRTGDAASLSFDKVKKSAKKAGDKVKEIKDEAEKFSEYVQDSFRGVGSELRGLIEGTKSWQDVLYSVLDTVVKIGFQQFSKSMGGFGGQGIFGDVLGGIVGGLLGFKDGADFMVGGHGGKDSQLVAFKASPDETVTVQTPEQRRDAANQNGGGTIFRQTNNITIQTPDVRSFKSSEAQVAARLALVTQRGARSL